MFDKLLNVHPQYTTIGEYFWNSLIVACPMKHLINTKYGRIQLSDPWTPLPQKSNSPT